MDDLTASFDIAAERGSGCSPIRGRDLLRYFVAHRGEAITRDRLLAEVWGRSWAISTRTVDNFVVRLRKHIEPEPAQPRYLITVHGRGYKLLRQ